MDWSKAKTYLILTFLLLDIVLGYQYWRLRDEQASYVQSFTEQLQDVRQLLAAQKWDLQTEVPRNTPEMGFLHVRYFGGSQAEWQKQVGGADRLLYKAPGQVSVTLSDKNFVANPEQAGIGEQLLSQLGTLVWQKENYRFDRTSIDKDGSGIITYLQSYNGYPVFSAPLEVLIQQNKAVRYNQVALQMKGEEGGKKQVISAILALRSLSESIDKTDKTPDNKVIRDVRLGYFSRTYNADEWYMTPVWRIITDRDTYYVNAMTGEVEQGR